MAHGRVSGVDLKYFKAWGIWQFITSAKYGSYFGVMHIGIVTSIILLVIGQIANTLTGTYEFTLFTEKLSVNLTIFEGMMKMGFYCYKQGTLKELISCFDQDLLQCTRQNEATARAVFHRSAKFINLSVKAFVVMIFSTITVWNLVPILRCLFQGKCHDWHILPMAYPDLIENNFALLYIIEFFIMIYTATLLYNVNCLFSALALSLSAQFQVLQIAISKIENNSMALLNLNRWEYGLLLHNHWNHDLSDLHYIRYQVNKTLKQKGMLMLLKECLRDHQKLLKLCKEMEEMYNPMFLFQMLISTLTICLVLVQLNVQLSSSEVINIPAMNKFIMYMVFCLMELLIYSIGGQIIQDQSANIHRSLSESGWSEGCFAYRTCILIALTRSNKPENLTAGKFYNVGLASFTQIVKASYSYFTFLRGSDNKSHSPKRL